jgi:hypothetical protein
VLFSLLLGVVMGKFIRFGQGMDQAKSFAFHAFAATNTKTPCLSGSSSTRDEDQG